MKEKSLKEVKELLKSGELTREEVLLELFTNSGGDLDLSGLDFSNFLGDVLIYNMKVNWNLNQSSHEVGGDLYQDKQKVSGDLAQDFHKIKGNLYQDGHIVEGDLYQTNHSVKGNLYQWEHNVKGDLHQYNHTVGGDLNQGKQKVEGNYYATDIKVKGKIDFEEPTKMLKKITLQELKEMGYELEEKE